MLVLKKLRNLWCRLSWTIPYLPWSICLNFHYGVNCFDKEKEDIKTRVKEKFKEYEKFLETKENEIIEYREELEKKSKERIVNDISHEKKEAKDELDNFISYNYKLLEYAETNKKKFPDENIKREKLREDYYTGNEKLIIKYDDEEICYKVLYRSAGKAKEGSVMALRFEPDKKESEQLYGKAKQFLRMGLDFQDEASHIVEIGAYQSLVASTTVGKVHIKPENILIIDDVDVFFKRNVVSIMDLLEKKDLIRPRNTNDDIKNQMKNTLWDGQALIDSNVFDRAYFFSSDEDLNGYILYENIFVKWQHFVQTLNSFLGIILVKKSMKLKL